MPLLGPFPLGLGPFLCPVARFCQKMEVFVVNSLPSVVAQSPNLLLRGLQRLVEAIEVHVEVELSERPSVRLTARPRSNEDSPPPPTHYR